LARLSVVEVRFVNDVLHGLNHDLFDLLEPLFDVTFGLDGVDNLDVLDTLALGGLHSVNLGLIVKFERLDSFKTFLEEGLDFQWVLGLR
jgi:hypothetical protein